MIKCYAHAQKIFCRSAWTRRIVPEFGTKIETAKLHRQCKLRA